MLDSRLRGNDGFNSGTFPPTAVRLRGNDGHTQKHRMSDYQDATIARQHRAEQADGNELSLNLLHGTNSALGHSCIHRVLTDRSGQLKSDIVYYYTPVIAAEVVNADFDLLASGRPSPPCS
jgi:hypothetical protein